MNEMALYDVDDSRREESRVVSSRVEKRRQGKRGYEHDLSSLTFHCSEMSAVSLASGLFTGLPNASIAVRMMYPAAPAARD
jgi:hypothetical protein